MDQQLFGVWQVQPIPLSVDLSCARVDRHRVKPDAVAGPGTVQDARAQEHQPQHEPHIHTRQEHVIQSRHQALH